MVIEVETMLVLSKDKSVTNITLVEVSLFAASKDKAGEPRGFSRG